MATCRCIIMAAVLVGTVGLVTRVSSRPSKRTPALTGAVSAKGVPVRIGVDPRVELMSVIFRLAGNPEYNQGRVPRYNAAIDSHFASVRDHPAVLLARRLREANDVSYDAVMSMAVHVQDADTLKERVPFDRPGITLDARWQGAEARPFLEAARRFVVDSRFREFTQSQQELYHLTSARLRLLVERQVDFTWFDRFFRTLPGAHFVLVPGLANGDGNYGPRIRADNGSEEFYAILGVADVDSAGLPHFAEGMIPTVVHEYNHSYVNPVTARHAASFEKAATRVFAAVADPMRRQAYGDWKTMINESLVRAAVARYILAHRGSQAANDEVQEQRANRFLWMPELVALLGEYQRERGRYPTFDAFMPRIVEYFDRLAPRTEDMVRRYEEARPQVVSMTPENGAPAVDPALTEMIFRFDRPMKEAYAIIETAGKDHYPDVLGGRFDPTGMLLRLRVRLRPDHQYEFRLNSRYSGTFRSREGIPMKMYQVRFRTGPPKPQPASDQGRCQSKTTAYPNTDRLDL
jgi:uncharacterized protein DUF4932